MAAEKYIKRHNLSFTNLIGEAEKVEVLFFKLTEQHLVGTPAILLFDPKGELRIADIGAVPTTAIESFIGKESL